MPSRLITTQSILRYIHRSTDDAQSLPQLDQDYTDIYKGEIVVNYSRNAPALYLRTGLGTEEASDDTLVRIGNVLVDDFEPYVDEPTLSKRGLVWYNLSDKQLHIHDGRSFVRVTNLSATEVIEGIVRRATETEVISGDVEEAYISPAALKEWAEYQSYVRRLRHTATIYVDALLGDDSLENDGSDPSYPLLSIERAILETLRRPINVIKVQPGEYFIDNRPGVTSLDNIKPVTYRDEQNNPVGPINPVGSWVVTEALIDGHSGSINVESDQTEETIHRGQQLFFEKDGAIVGSAIVGKATVETQDDASITASIQVRNARGTIEPRLIIRVARYSSFNDYNSGVIVPPGCNFIAEGDVTLRPRFITHYNPIEEADPSYLFKVTQRIQFKGFTFRDSVQAVTHHMFSLITNATQEDLQTGPIQYLHKVSRGLGTPAVEIGDSFTNQTRLPWLELDDCMVDTRYGSNFMTFGGSFYSEMKDILVKDLVCLAAQQDSQMYDITTDLEGNEVPVLKDGIDNWVVRIDASDYRVMFNGGYTKYVPNFSIVDNNTNAIVNVGNHLILDDAPPPLPTDVNA